jgi:hypothetical protein
MPDVWTGLQNSIPLAVLPETRPPFLLRSFRKPLDNGLDHPVFLMRHYCRCE